MPDIDYSRELASLNQELGAIKKALNPEELARRIQVLESDTSNPDMWLDQELARKTTTQLSQLRSRLTQFEKCQSGLQDLAVLLEIAVVDDKPETWQELIDQLAAIKKSISELNVETLLNNEFDSRGAIITIRAGAGGDDATDFAEMLMRMYIRYVEKQGHSAQVLDVSYAEGAGIKSSVIEVDYPYAFGKLSIETGTHRLVRMSPFNAAGKRQTSFAAVEVVPLIETSDEVDIADAEIRIDVFRSSGPGGQSVNTTDSAVRITHLPTGIVVSCQNEKSQLQNKQAAIRVLQSKLLERRRQEEDERLKKISGDVKASWGEQMRSYVLAPYQMVKDLRTDFEVNNPQAVFDGDLEGFISAGISWRASQK